MKRILAFSTLLSVTAAGLPLLAASQETYDRNWPEWRGPTGNGVALYGNPPLEWSETKNIKWKVAIPGEGHATPVIWGDRIFLLTAVASGTEDAAASGADRQEAAQRGPGRAGQGGQGEPGGRRGAGGFGRGGGGRGGSGGGGGPTTAYEFTVLCLDRNTGQVLWSKVSRKEVPHEGRQQSNTHASSSAATDGEHVFAFFGSHGLYCYDLNGELVWEKDYGDMRTKNGFGEGASPALSGNTLVVVWDTEDESFITALDKRTGQELWKKDRDEGTGWTTPRIVEHGGRKQVIVNATGAVRSYDLATGDLLWSCRGQTDNAIPAAVADNRYAYVMSGFRRSAAFAFKLDAKGDLSGGSDAVVWKLNRGTPYVPSPLLYNGKLFFSQNIDARVSCVDAATGEAFYSQETLEGLRGVYASPVGAAGRIYLPSQNGATAVLAEGKELKVLAVNALDERFNASPAVVGDELFLRGANSLYCIAAP